jgi:anaerobic nitric oxide reductase transcription regulator
MAAARLILGFVIPVHARALEAAARGLARQPGAGASRRLIAALGRISGADATTLLIGDQRSLVPRVTVGLDARAARHRLELGKHPRLQALLGHDGVLRFSADDPRPDPWDGFMVEGTSGGCIHACMGQAIALDADGDGDGDGERGRAVLTLDALTPGRFGPEHEDLLSGFAALALIALAGEQPGLASGDLREPSAVREFIGESPAICHLLSELALVAPTAMPVLIEGESGTGKELVAEAIHRLWIRARPRVANPRPLVRVNCAALPQGLAESVLFGHRRGAFTGAHADHRGVFEQADGGTLLLDEVGELDLGIQAKLLRVLQSGELQPIGAERTRRVHVRTLAATHRDLQREIQAGRFREDLWYRLAGFRLRVPPLRERGHDRLAFAEHFVGHAGASLGIRAPRLSAEARRAVLDYDWPGNVRELEHRIARACLRAAARSPLGSREGEISVADLELDHERPGSSNADPGASPSPLLELPSGGITAAVDELRVALIQRAVLASDGNWAEAARRLGLDRSNLHRMARRLGLR